MRRDEWYFLISRPNFGGSSGGQAERTPYSSCFPHLHQTEGVRLGKHGSSQSTCRGTRDLIVRRSRLCGGRGGGGQRGEKTGHKQNQDHALPHRYQVERCAGPVEVRERESEHTRPTQASGDSISKTGERSSLMGSISIGIQERSSFLDLYTIF